tara:strand:+ start:244 stop:678 length:435 start_codon:yes stop_codon:yes gene_type:complete
MQFRFNVIRIISKVHGYIYSGSGGRIGKKLGNQDIALLTTIGRKSGKRRNVPVALIRHEEQYLIIGSFGGSPVHPAWFLNIETNPDVQIRLGRAVVDARASIIRKADDEYEKLWNKAVSVYQGFDSYKRATYREIPIIVLSPEN